MYWLGIDRHDANFNDDIDKSSDTILVLDTNHQQTSYYFLLHQYPEILFLPCSILL